MRWTAGEGLPRRRASGEGVGRVGIAWGGGGGVSCASQSSTPEQEKGDGGAKCGGSSTGEADCVLLSYSACGALSAFYLFRLKESIRAVGGYSRLPQHAGDTQWRVGGADGLRCAVPLKRSIRKEDERGGKGREEGKVVRRDAR